MNVFRHLTAGLKELVRRDKTESELTEELNTYLRNVAEAKIREGATPEEALRSARLELGGMIVGRIGTDVRNAFPFMGQRCDRVVRTVLTRLAAWSAVPHRAIEGPTDILCRNPKFKR